VILRSIDERFIHHRYRATSHAAVVGGVLTGGLFLYYQLFEKTMRWDLAVILLAMAVTKIAAMLYYRYTD
jgi:hypothetical protein